MLRKSAFRYVSLFAASILGFAGYAHANDGDIHLNIAAIQSRMIGSVLGPTDPISVSMFNAIQSGGESESAYQSAAEQLIIHPNFSRNKLRDYFFVMQNLEMTHQVPTPINKPVAFMIAKAVQNRDIRTIFTANETCRIVLTVGAAPVEPETVTAAQLSNLDLRTAIVCTPGQVANNGAVTLPPEHTAGYLTLAGINGFMGNMLVGGVAMRPAAQLFQSTLGKDYSIEKLRSTQYDDKHVQRFVTRNPAGSGLAVFHNECKTCHEPGGRIYGAFCLNFSTDDNGALTYAANPNATQTKCAGSNNQQRQNPDYPDGYLPGTPEWTNPFLPSVDAALGNRNTAQSGVGVNSLGFFFSNLDRVYEYFVERVYNGVNGVCPGIEYNRAGYQAHVQELIATGDIAKTFAHVAASKPCLGL